MSRSVSCVGFLALALSGCSHFDALAIGEALTIGDHRVSPAIAMEVARGSGSSDARDTVFTEIRGRALFAGSRQQIAGFAGASQLRWVGSRSPLWGGANLGLGLEHVSGTVFIEPIAHARIGTGFVLREEIRRPPLPELRPPRPALNMVDTVQVRPHITRTRQLLTLALAGDVDFRFTRAPLGVFALMIGIANVVEYWTP